MPEIDYSNIDFSQEVEVEEDYSFQDQDAAEAAKRRRVIISHSLGAGKSLIAIKACDILAKDTLNQKVLLITKRSLTYNFSREIIKHAEKSYSIGREEVVILNGTDRIKLKLLEKEARFIVCSYADFRKYNRFIREGEKSILAINSLHSVIGNLNNRKFDVVLIDEAHYLRGQKSQQYKGIEKFLKLNSSCCLYLITGTRQWSKVEDEFSILHLINPKEFSSRYAWVEKWFETKLDRWSRTPKVVKVKCSEEYIAYHAKYVLTRPPIERPCQVIDIHLEMDKSHRDKYNFLRKNMYLELGNKKVIEATNALSKLNLLRQMAISKGMLEDPPNIEGEKLDALDDFLENVSDEPIVIASYYKKCVNLLYEHLKSKRKVVFFTGDQNDKHREQAISDFQTGIADTIIITTDSGSEGQNFQNSHILICFEEDYISSRRKQLLARVARPGQKHMVIYVNFIYDKSIETTIRAIREARGRLFSDIDIAKFALAEELTQA